MTTALIDYQTALKRAFISGVVTKVATVFLTMGTLGLAARSLGAGQFGVVGALAGVASLLAFLDLGVSNALVNRIASAHANGGEQEAYALARHVVRWLVLIGCGVGSIMGTVAVFLPVSLFFPGSSASEMQLRLAALVTAVAVAVALPSTVGARGAVALQRGELNSAVLFIGGAVTISMAAVGAWLDLGMPYFLVSITLVPVLLNCALTAHVLTLLRRDARESNTTTSGSIKLMPMVRLGVPFSLMSLSGSLTFYTGPLVLAYVASPSAAAVYVLSSRMFTAISSLYAAGLQQLWGSLARALSLGHLPQARQLIRQWSALVLGSSVLLALLLVIFGQFIVRLWAGEDLVPPRWLLAALGVWSVYSLAMSLLSHILNAAGRIWGQALGSLGMAATAVPLSILLSAEFGVVGPTIASTVAHLIFVAPVSIVLAVRALGRQSSIGRPSADPGVLSV